MTTLDDLRKANLAEQRPPAPQPAGQSATTEARTPASTQVRKRVTAEPSTQALTDGSAQGLTHGLEEAPTEARKRTAADAGTEGPPAEPTVSPRRRTAPSQPKLSTPDDPFVERVREAIGNKTVHPGGVKATVEMPADLSLRAKRYCLDHGGVPVRQVFLELMAAFLDEEGY